MDNVKKETHKCPYCQNVENEALCPYCEENGPHEHSGDDCPYCLESSQQMDHEHSGDDCPYCKQSEAPHHLPTTQDSEDFKGQALDAPDIPKPNPSEDPPMQMGPPTDVESVNNKMLDEPVSELGEINEEVSQGIPKEDIGMDHSKEAMQAIAKEIEDGSGPESKEKDLADSVTPDDLANGDNMDGNVSRPEGFATNNSGDLGLNGEAQLDDSELTDVLHEGLDSHAEEIKREKVIQMVAQALQGFKASKNVIEGMQQQYPQLYQSSIAMLLAMIEMAKILGLGGEEISEEDHNEWSDPFPVHPDSGGKPMVGQAASPGDPQQKDDLMGQSIGKLPASATTKHIAKKPLPEGAVNERGQMKVTNPETGKISMIDMSQGRVLNASGKPVKPSIPPPPVKPKNKKDGS